MRKRITSLMGGIVIGGLFIGNKAIKKGFKIGSISGFVLGSITTMSLYKSYKKMIENE